MKKFDIKKIDSDSWLVSHNELPRFTCRFEDRKFNYSRTIRTFRSYSRPDRDPAAPENGKMARPVSYGENKRLIA